MLAESIIAELKKELEAEQTRLEGELSEIATKNPAQKGDWEATYPVSEDDTSASSGSLEEMSDEIEEYDTRLSEERTLEQRLRDVRDALTRIKTGSYGICTICGTEIPLERLRANPAAATDIQHTAQ